MASCSNGRHKADWLSWKVSHSDVYQQYYFFHYRADFQQIWRWQEIWRGWYTLGSADAHREGVWEGQASQSGCLECVIHIDQLYVNTLTDIQRKYWESQRQIQLYSTPNVTNWSKSLKFTWMGGATMQSLESVKWTRKSRWSVCHFALLDRAWLNKPEW